MKNQKKIKVLIIITTSFVPYGGLTSVMMNYYRRMDKSMFHFDFASTNTEVDSNLLEELSNWDTHYYSLGNRRKRPIQYARRLSHILEENKYDIVHVNSNSATAVLELSIAKRHGVANRVVHNHTSICDHPKLHVILKPLFMKTYTDAIACSDKAGLWIFGNNDFYVLNNGIDTERFRFRQDDREYVRNKYNISDSTIVFGHVGKIYKAKNHLFLISVFCDYLKKNENAILMLVGDGIMRTEIEDEVHNKGLEKKVIFAGMQTKVEKYLAAMDLFLFPSLWEGMPLSVIEAQASGLACFISKNIDSGVAITDDVIMLPIDSGTEKWTSVLPLPVIEIGKNRIAKSENNIIKIKEACFDSVVCSEVLEKIYLNSTKL